MNLGGWITIVLSWGIIIVLTIFCYVRLFGQKRLDMKAPLEIETDKS